MGFFYMQKYYVYILISNKSRRYIGYTSNLEQRLSQHNRKHHGFTGTDEVWQIEIVKECETKEEAMTLEKYLKSMKNARKAAAYLRRIVG